MFAMWKREQIDARIASNRVAAAIFPRGGRVRRTYRLARVGPM
jgi:hypothetical protein